MTVEAVRSAEKADDERGVTAEDDDGWGERDGGMARGGRSAGEARCAVAMAAPNAPAVDQLGRGKTGGARVAATGGCAATATGITTEGKGPDGCASLDDGSADGGTA